MTANLAIKLPIVTDETGQSTTIHQQRVIKPSMCGHNSLFVGQVGDWTWDSVSEQCGTNVFNAKNANGAPTYLAFYYYHIKASAGFHPGLLTFGDKIDVNTRLFSFGSESVLTLHKIGKSKNGNPVKKDLELKEFYESPKDDSIYIENFNRWISRSKDSDNEGLVPSSPSDFNSDHLDELPLEYSPRRTYDLARRNGTFLSNSQKEVMSKQAENSSEYNIDITRDLNGVGLLYFTSYFSIVDRAVLELWRKLGRDDASFLARAVTDHKLCLMGNVNFDAKLTIETELWSSDEKGTKEEFFNVVIKEPANDRTIAVATLQIESKNS